MYIYNFINSMFIVCILHRMQCTSYLYYFRLHTSKTSRGISYDIINKLCIIYVTVIVIAIVILV